MAMKKLSKPTAYVIILLLTYAMGYFSAPSSTLTRFSPSAQSSTSTLSSPSSEPIQLANYQSELDNFRLTTRCADPLPPQLVRQTILDRVYFNTSPYDNFPPAHVRHLLRDKRIKGWGSNGDVFSNLINKVKPAIIIEVGTFLGASAIHMAGLIREIGLDTQIICVDDFRGWAGFRDRFKDIQMVNGDILLLYQFIQNVMSVNASGSILPVPFSSGSALDRLCEWGVLGDLIEVDAGHDFNSAWADINRAYRILRPGGVLFGHDYFTAADNKGVRRAVNLFAKVNGLRVKVDGQHWVLA